MKHSVWLLLVLTWSCGTEPAPWPCAELAPGAIVIAEVMADPSGVDGPSEWIELAANGAGGHLGGAVLAVLRGDGRADGLMLPDLTIPSAGRLVLSSATPASLPTFADWSFAGLMTALPNTAVTIELRCGATLIDRASLPAPQSGRSIALDGRLGTDPDANDHPAAWCASTTAMNDDDFGTPGRANDLCLPPPGWCSEDGAVTRPVRKPDPGAIRITEVMADPVTLPDAEGEWLELHVQAGVDLGAIAVATHRAEPRPIRSDGFCDPTDAVQRVVLRPTGKTRRLPVSLGNSGVTISVQLASHVLDRVTVPSARAGESWMLGKEDPPTWCWSDRNGPSPPTPGAVNGPCPEVTATWCREDGHWRAPRVPDPGDLRITEVMASPTVTRDTWGDWFEVRVERDVDLAGLAIHNDAATDSADVRLPAENCLPVTAGATVIFARDSDPSKNGGLPVPIGAAPALPDEGLLLLTANGLTITATTWTPVSPGHTIQLDLDTGRWCESPDRATGGTPGRDNPPCPRPAAPQPAKFRQVLFSELMIDGAGKDPDGEYIELQNTGQAPVDLYGCQLAADGQRPMPLPPLLLPAGGFAVLARPASGISVATVAPTFALGNTQGALELTCGQRRIDAVSWRSDVWPIEPAVSWQHGANRPVTAPGDHRDWCPSRSVWTYGLGTPGRINLPCPLAAAPPPLTGEVIVTEIMHSPSGVDRDGEYLEWLNVSDRTVDLLGCLFYRRTGDPFRVAGSALMQPGERLVITAPGRNDGLPWTWSSGLVASADHVALWCSGVLIDEVAWDGASGFPDGKEGASWQLDPRWTAADANDYGPAWCRSTADSTIGGLGSPGAANAPCF